MPMHDWTRAPSGLFHHFHQVWSVTISRTLNRGLLPDGLSALVEQRSGGFESDVLAIEMQLHNNSIEDPDGTGGAAVLEKPRTRIIRKSNKEFYAEKANRIVIRHRLGKVIAFIEIVSPGNKDTLRSVAQFVDIVNHAIYQGVHVLILDLFPPGKRDPLGLHSMIWQDMDEEEEEVILTKQENRLLASYEASPAYIAYLETIAVGSTLPDMPLFIAPGAHVVVPLEATYQEAWEDTPASVRRLVVNTPNE